MRPGTTVVPPAPPAPPTPALPQSAYRGVIWSSKHSKWVAQVHCKQSDGSRASATAGYHDSELAAAQAYNLRAQQVLGDEAQLNNLRHHATERVLPPKIRHGYRGVTWDTQRQRWLTRCTTPGRASRSRCMLAASLTCTRQPGPATPWRCSCLGLVQSSTMCLRVPV